MTFRQVDIGWRSNGPAEQIIWGIREDRFGTMWVATSMGLRRLWPDGRIDVHFPEFGVHSVLEDRSGRVWAGTRLSGLLELTLEAPSGRVAATRRHTITTGLPSDWINQLFEAKDGELWAASTGGLIQLTRTSSSSPRIRVIAEAQGLGRGEVQSLTLDRDGNMWIAMIHAGAAKIARTGFSAFGPADGVPFGLSLMQSRAGDLCFVGPAKPEFGLHCFNGVSFDARTHPPSARRRLTVVGVEPVGARGPRRRLVVRDAGRTRALQEGRSTV